MNNSDVSFPPIMNDGRMFTDFVPSEFRDIQLSNEMGFQNVYQQHEYYNDNTEKIIKDDQLKAEQSVNFANTPLVTVDPFEQDEYWDARKRQLGLI